MRPQGQVLVLARPAPFLREKEVSVGLNPARAVGVGGTQRSLGPHRCSQALAVASRALLRPCLVSL